mgnify:CR=1 FL=1
MLTCVVIVSHIVLFFLSFSIFFFFKQKTAYEMLRSLVGSEMCIRDRHDVLRAKHLVEDADGNVATRLQSGHTVRDRFDFCLLYTSDAADDLLCVDLGGRRIIKKKKHNKTSTQYELK